MHRRTEDREWLTPLEVARMTGFTASFIRQECRTGLLLATYVTPSGRRRGRWLIRVTAAEAYLRQLGLTHG